MLIERDFKLSDFSSLVGQRFLVKPHPELNDAKAKWRLEIELIEAEDQTLRFGGVKDGSLRDPFCLLFRAADACMLDNQTHRIEHSTLGEFDLFLSPVVTKREAPSADSGHVYYEAVFN